MAEFDRHAYLMAIPVIQQYGLAAPYCALALADELADIGDFDGAASWRRIKGAIEEMLAMNPGDGTKH